MDTAIVAVLISAAATLGNIIYARAQRKKVEAESKNIDASTDLRKRELEKMEQDTTFHLYEQYQRSTADVIRLTDEVLTMRGELAELKAKYTEIAAKLETAESDHSARERAFAASETLRTELERALNQERSLRVQYELENKSLASRLAVYEGANPQ